MLIRSSGILISSGGGGFGQPQARGDGHLYPKSSPVKRLSKKKFPDSSAKHEWLVEFYSMRDQTSVKMQSIVESIAKDLSNKVKVGAVNCDKSVKFCRSQGISSYPTFHYIWEGKSVEYEGEMDEYLIYNFAVEKHIARRRKMRDSDEIQVLHSGSQGVLCNIGKNSGSPSVMCGIFVLAKGHKKHRQIAHAMAKKFKSGIQFSWVDPKTQSKALKKLPSVSSPGLIIIRAKRGKIRAMSHQGDFTETALQNTLDRAIGGDLQMDTMKDTTIDFK